MVQGLRLHASCAGDVGSIPGQGTKIPHASWCGPKNASFFKNSIKKKCFNVERFDYICISLKDE